MDCSVYDGFDAGTIGIPDAEGPADCPLAKRARDRRDPRAAKAMRRAKEHGVNPRGCFDRRRTAREILTDVRGQLEVELPVKPAVVADRMPVLGDLTHEVRPLIGVTAQDE